MKNEKVLISILAMTFSIISMIIGIVLSCYFLSAPNFPMWVRGLCVFCFIASGVFTARAVRLLFTKKE